MKQKRTKNLLFRRKSPIPAMLLACVILCAPASGIMAGESTTEVIKNDVLQQRKKVSGIVKDNTGEPIIGASVAVRGTSIGTVSNVEGNFELEAPEGSILIISYVGYHTQEVVANKEVLNVVLRENTQDLDEVVVVGYGTVKKKDLTGSVGSIRRKDVGDVSVVNVEQMIQGRVAGVDVTTNTGFPGTGTSIKIRGVGTIYNSDPLYVIDGMPGDINSVSQYDIESIEILKDASSTSIYGARAANGVVLVTTKRGQKGAVKVSLNAYTAIAQTPKKLELLNADQYIDLVTELNPNFFCDAKRFVPQSEGGLGMTEEWARTTRTNMMDEVFRSALQQEYHVNVSGGGENAIFNVSGAYTNMDAITKGADYERLNLLANVEFTVRKYVKIGQSLSLKRTNTNDIHPEMLHLVRWAPYMPVEDPENSWGFSKTTTANDLNDNFNPMTKLTLENSFGKSTFIREQAYVDVSFLNMFKWRTQIQYTNESRNGLMWFPYTENGNMENPAKITETYQYSESGMIENYLNFNKEIGVHSINAMVGNTYSSNKQNNGRSVEISGSGSDTQAWENYNVLLVTKTPKSTVVNNNTWHSAYLSYYGRINYSLMDKYLLTFNYRQDASPNFSPKNRWGRFPSLALAWKIDQEGFMRKYDKLSQLKLRLSWGKSGNDRINNYAYLANLYSGQQNNIVSAIGTGLNQFSGITINGIPANDIRWETTTSYNIGIDAGILNNSLTASLDVYTRLTDGILIKVPIPGSSGIDESPFSNAAEVRNTGVEFQTTYNKSLGKVNLSVSGVVSYNKNEVTSLGKGEPIVMDELRTEKGHSIGEYYGYKVDRVLPTTADAEAYNQKYGTSVQAGDIAFMDLAGPKDENGNPTGPDGKIDDNDRTFIGKSIPAWNFGMNFNVTYRDFDFQLALSGIAGNKLYDRVRIFDLDAMKRPFNQTTEVLKRWRKEGDITDVPRAVEADPSNNLRSSDRYIKDGSYLRIKNVTVGYTIPFPANEIIDRLRLYVSCQNLYTFTKYDGFDPEVGGDYGNDSQNSNMKRGVVHAYNMVPIPRTFLFGIQATF